MKSSAKNIQLTPLDDLFKTDAERKDETLERVQQIPIEQLFPFKNHPFQVRDDESMKSTVKSVKLVGAFSSHCAPPTGGRVRAGFRASTPPRLRTGRAKNHAGDRAQPRR
jgi:hypothetical protein